MPQKKQKLFYSKHWFFSTLKRRRTWNVVLCVVVATLLISSALSSRIIVLYSQQESRIIQDRNGAEILIQPNIKGHYMRPVTSVPQQFQDALIAKEDRFFFYHPGINPGSILRDIFAYPFSRRLGGSSTITQQLVKTLLGNENKRTFGNKLMESFYALSLELHTNKREILRMYANTAYFGNQVEGIGEASTLYFHTVPDALDTSQILQLLATLSNPNDYPGTRANKKKTIAFARVVNIPLDETSFERKEHGDAYRAYQRKDSSMFELQALGTHCVKPCSLTVDEPLTHTVREILRTNLDSPAFASVDNGAVVVIRLDTNAERNELLALIGSPHPASPMKGYQVNMAVRPRPIGSTAKPFIYAKAFEKGVRPYTQVEDREYKYDIGTGFAFYPKNYDGIYRGTVTLHQALANSLNVPAVRVLQYAGLDSFYNFLKKDMRFVPIQPLETYALSIALGGLEMDPLTLANYFTIFPNQGILKPLAASTIDILRLPMAEPFDRHTVIDPVYTELVTKILSDRQTGIDQFGLKSNLNLPATNYAVKTGTSYDYHDSWTIGYTPDFLVAVWLGNSSNKPMHELSGSIGAGKIWHEVMEVMLNSPYNKQTVFDFSHIKEYQRPGTLEYGLAGDHYDQVRNLLMTDDIILTPHHRDTLQYADGMSVPLLSSEQMTWYANNIFLGRGTSISWKPHGAGTYRISARTVQGKLQIITVVITDEDG